MADIMSSLSLIDPSVLLSVCLVQFGLLFSVLASRFLSSSSSSSSDTTTMSPNNGRVTRITMFKVPDEENQKKFVQVYDQLAKDQQRNGKPYILSVQAAVVNDPRAKGYTIVAETEFANHDDMKYYDTECPAHLVLKKASRGLGVTEPPLIVYY